MIKRVKKVFIILILTFIILLSLVGCIEPIKEPRSDAPNPLDLSEEDVEFFGEIGKDEVDFYYPVSMSIKTIGTDKIMVVVDRTNKNIVRINLGQIEENTLNGFSGTIINYVDYGVPFSITIDDNDDYYVLSQRVDDSNIKRIKLQKFSSENEKPNEEPDWEKDIYPEIDIYETITIDEKDYATEFSHITKLSSIGSDDLIISNNSSYYYTKNSITRMVKFGPDGENPDNDERMNYRKLRNISMTNPDTEDENIWTWPEDNYTVLNDTTIIDYNNDNITNAFDEGDGYYHFSYIDQELFEEDVPSHEGIGYTDIDPVLEVGPLNDTIIDVFALNDATLDSENIFVLYLENYSIEENRIDNDGKTKNMIVSRGIHKIKSFNASTGVEVNKYTFVGTNPYIDEVYLGSEDDVNNPDYQFYYDGWLMDANSIALDSTGDMLFILKFNQGYVMRFQRDGNYYKFVDSIDIRLVNEKLKEPDDIEFYSDGGINYLIILDSKNSRFVRIALN